jgi:hypothetical protein
MTAIRNWLADRFYQAGDLLHSLGERLDTAFHEKWGPTDSDLEAFDNEEEYP